ncbi:MAG: hypothetical protein ACTSO5_10730 [Candidatus Heimdallarchaeaceae archaeon]
MSSEEENTLEVLGALIEGFAQACINLNIIASSETKSLIKDVEANKWYPLKILRDLEEIVIKNYENYYPILERAGAEMMLVWFNFGPGKQIINKGVDFLQFQSGSQGYASVVKGPEKLVGSFKIEKLDEKQGTALIHSTTPFNKNLERGIIIGGMSAPGDLDYIDVNNEEDEYYFNIEFK